MLYRFSLNYRNNYEPGNSLSWYRLLPRSVHSSAFMATFKQPALNLFQGGSLPRIYFVVTHFYVPFLWQH